MKRCIGGITTLAVALTLSTAALAQGPGGPGGGGGFQPTPQMKAWQKFRDNHKNYRTLQQTVYGLAELDKDPKTRLTKVQAKKILAVLTPWRAKPTMTDAQALKLSKDLTAPLTLAQLKKLATSREGGNRMGGGRPGGGGPGGPGGGGPGGPGGGGNRTAGPGAPGGGGRPGGGFTMPAPKEYNPVNPATLPFERMRPRAKQRMDQMMATLQARAR